MLWGCAYFVCRVLPPLALDDDASGFFFCVSSGPKTTRLAPSKSGHPLTPSTILRKQYPACHRSCDPQSVFHDGVLNAHPETWRRHRCVCDVFAMCCVLIRCGVA